MRSELGRSFLMNTRLTGLCTGFKIQRFGGGGGGALTLNPKPFTFRSQVYLGFGVYRSEAQGLGALHLAV